MKLLKASQAVLRVASVVGAGIYSQRQGVCMECGASMLGQSIYKAYAPLPRQHGLTPCGSAAWCCSCESQCPCHDPRWLAKAFFDWLHDLSTRTLKSMVRCTSSSQVPLSWPSSIPLSAPPFPPSARSQCCSKLDPPWPYCQPVTILQLHMENSL